MTHSIIPIAQIAGAVVLSMAILWAEHYSPWEHWTGRKLPRPAAYTLGVLAMVLPLSGLYGWWVAQPPTHLAAWALGALWAVVAFSGLTVYGLYLIDGRNAARRESRMNEQIAEALKEGNP